MKIRMLWICFVVWAALVPAHASALSCARPPSIEKSYELYDAVVVANVDDVIRKKNNKELKLTVLSSFKGMVDRNVAVAEDVTWGMSERGKQYLFFLKKKEGGWENPLCSPTKLAGNASQEISFLEEKEIPLKAAEVPVTNESAPSHWKLPVILMCALSALVYGGVRFGKKRKGKNE
ncbi:hypothetical protein [Paenibacillus aceris]|uniref:Uncharacterized protein n=1 Tax=Paenibacillus aceris TaxID=869555 RepID=A0ABS4I4Y9_9BACL|nr:hypothetical protein [Paenibacillus aceris]MBP1965895.1 hypothetical protein [Paenibacillus aceris]NHW35106.1 hypothetical protein [Paenibacillus aceris]